MKRMSIFNKFKKYFKSFSDALKFAWAVVRGKAIKFAKVKDGEVREMIIESIVKVNENGLLLVIEDGKYKQFYISNLIF